jgi:3-oxoacyl-[acyl-carrier-protein] synthase-1
MRRVVVTGAGIVSCLGNGCKTVLGSLRSGLSGIAYSSELRELGLKCQVAGRVANLDALRSSMPKPMARTKANVTLYAWHAAAEAVADAQLPAELLASHRAGIIVGTGVGGLNELLHTDDVLTTDRRPNKVGAARVVTMFQSTAALSLAAHYGAKGRCYSVSSACATGTDAIGHAFQLVSRGVLDTCICGGAEELWTLGAALLDNGGVLPSGYNDRPTQACRPYDCDRQGMVLSEGAGILVLETLDRAVSRGVAPYAEIVGYGSANDGCEMFQPTGFGLRRAVLQALRMAETIEPVRIDYINPHGAGTRIGDPVEIAVIRELFPTEPPLVSSTKALAGHSQSATGAHEAIFTLLMARSGFLCPTANLQRIDPNCGGVRHVPELIQADVRMAMSFNAGLGGTNACLIFRMAPKI